MSFKSDTGSALRESFHAFLLEMADRFAPYPLLKMREEEIRRLAASVLRPFTLAVFGRMKTGKSSLINALVGRPLAITGVEEATATVNWISHGDTANETTMLVHWKDGRTDSLPVGRIQDWTGKSPEVLERVKDTSFLQLYANIELLRGMEIVDTPGTGAVVDEHEEVARRFLSPRATEDSEAEGRKADALLYVFPPVARESDQGTLDDYGNTRMPGSDPYNSIGVLHKWDALVSGDIVAEAERKAARLHELLADMVCDVIPVSAPLALVARDSPDSYLESLLEITRAPGAADALPRYLRMDTRWRDDELRRRAYEAYPLPWASFARVVRLLIERECGDAEEARSACLEASGIRRLELEIDARFFRRAALIKQRLARVKAREPITAGLRDLNRRIDELSADHRHFRVLASQCPADSPHGPWLNAKSETTREEHQAVEDYAVEADRLWLVEEDRMEMMELDLAFLEFLRVNPDMVEERDRECIQQMLGEQDFENRDVPSQVLEAMLSRYGHLVHSPDRSKKAHFEHLANRLQSALLWVQGQNLPRGQTPVH